MKLKDRIRLAKRSIWGRKGEWVKITFVLFIATVVILATSGICLSFYKYADEYILGSPTFRSILVCGDASDENTIERTLRDVASSNEHIINVEEEVWGVMVEVDEPLQYVPPEFDASHRRFGQISLQDNGYYDERYLVDGHWIKSDASNVGIIPKQFSFIGESEDLVSTNFTYIDGASLIGKKLTTHYYTYKESEDSLQRDLEFEYTFTVIGTFDNIAANAMSSTVVIPYKDLSHIYHQQESHANDVGSVGIAYRAIIDDKNNVNNALAQIKNAYSNDLYLSIDVCSTPGKLFDITYMIEGAGIMFSRGLFLLSLFLMLLMIHKSIKKRTNEIGVYKAIGYSNTDVTLNILLEVLGLGLAVFTFSMLTSFLILKGLDLLVALNTSLFYNKLRFHFDGSTIIYSLILCTFIPLLSSLYGIIFAIKLDPKESISKVCD